MQLSLPNTHYCVQVLVYLVLLPKVESRHKARGQGQEHNKIRGQGQGQPSEDRPSRSQGQESLRQRPRTKDTCASVLKKKRSSKSFSCDLQKRKQKRFSQIFREFSRVFLHNFKNEQIPIMVGTDANAHRTIWGSSDINL